MKLKKEMLDTLTQNSIGVGVLAITGLISTRCPVTELYQIIEENMELADNLRKEMGLETLTPPELAPGKLSGLIKKVQARLKEKEEKKNKIGFHAPGDKPSEEKATDAEVSVESDEVEIDDLKDIGKDISRLEIPVAFKVKKNTDWN